jgi:hypothetical protein
LFLFFFFFFLLFTALGVAAISFTGDAAKDFAANVRGVARVVDGNGMPDVGLPPSWPYSFRCVINKERGRFFFFFSFYSTQKK